MSAGGEYIVWLTGGRRYGLEIGLCQEVVKGVQLTPIPRAPAYVAGLVNLRGTVLAVLDLDVLMGYSKITRKHDAASLIRIRTEAYPTAIIADSIVDATAISGGAIEAAPANLSENESRFIARVAKTPEGLVLIPDVKIITENVLVNKRRENA